MITISVESDLQKLPILSTSTTSPKYRLVVTCEGDESHLKIIRKAMFDGIERAEPLMVALSR